MEKLNKRILFISIIFIYAAFSFFYIEKQVFASDGGGYAITGQISGVGYDSEIFDANNGLPTSDANCILGSSDGYIWIGGYSGVLRYDGMEFEKLDTTNGLTSARGMYEDSHGRIWVGTNDNGVVLIDKTQQKHFTYNEGLTSTSIRSFAEDDLENVYIGTTSGVCYADKNLKISTIYDERIINERILELEKGLDGKIYGQTKTGAVFSLKNGLVEDFYQSDELGMEQITSILVCPNKEGYIYLGTEKGRVLYGEFGAELSKMEIIDVYENMSVNYLSYDCGRIWVTSSEKAGYLDENKNYHELKNVPINSSIEMMTSDYQGNMWFASSSQGVMKVVTSNFENLTSEANLEKEVANTTCYYNDMLYVGTDSGLVILNKNKKSIENKLTEYFDDTRIRCIKTDADGNLWFSTFTNEKGVVRYDANGNIKEFTVDDGMPSNEIRATSQTRDGSILAATNAGLAVIKNDSVIKTVDETWGLKNVVFLTAQEGENGAIYVGTDGDGIYEIKDDDVKKIGIDNGLTSEVILRITKDEKRNLYWIVTSNSIEYLKDGKIKNVKTFPFNNNYEIHFDKNDNVWIVSAYGLYKVKVDDMLNDTVSEYELYTIANGLPALPTSNCYCDIDSAGNLYLAGRIGVTKVNIDNFFELSAQVKMGLSYIKCGNERILPDSEGKYIIPAVDGRIQIMPAVMDYTMANPTVKVFLENREDEGIICQKSKLSSLEYTGLEYGDYILHIQIIDEGRGNVIQDEVFKITKKPQFYELFVIKVIIVIIFVAVAGILIWRVMKGTIIRKQYEQIMLAKKEVENANKAKARFLGNISYEITSPINTIMGMNEMIFREKAEDVPKEYFTSINNYALGIKNASQSLLGFVNDLLDMSNIEEGKLKLHEREYDCKEEMQNVEETIKSITFTKDLKFYYDIDESIPQKLYGDVDKIKKIINKLVRYVTKNTQIGDFILKIFVEEKTNETCKLRFSIKHNNLLESKKSDENEVTMDIIVKLVEFMQGEIWENKENEDGTEFIFTIEQKIIDRSPIGFYEEQNNLPDKQYTPEFIAPDAEVLLVDKDTLNLDIIKGFLKWNKMFVTTSQTMEECLEKIKYGNFNVVFVDQMINGESEKENIKRIREINKDIPVYLMTTNATEGEYYYKEVGYNGYIAKPVNSKNLEKIIMKHIPEDMRMNQKDIVEK